jgi:hypothetical protein
MIVGTIICGDAGKMNLYQVFVAVGFIKFIIIYIYLFHELQKDQKFAYFYLK